MAGIMSRCKQGMRTKAVAGASLAILFLAGCATPFRQADDGFDADHPLPDPEIPITITDESRNRARALALYARAQIHEFNREPALAIEAYRRAIEYDPDSEQLFLRLALAYIRAAQFDEAADLFQVVAERNPDQAQPLLWRGAMLRQRDRHDEAEELFREALVREPASPQAHLHLYELLIQQDRMAEASATLEEAVAVVAEPAPFYQLLGEIRWQQSTQVTDESERARLWDEAQAAWEEALERLPEHAGTWAQLGDLHMRRGAAELAKQHYQEAIRLDPTLVEPKWRLVLLHEQAGQLDEVVELLESLAVLQPNDARVFLSLGAAYEQLGKFDLALRSYRAASRVGRPTTATYLKLAVLQMEDDPDQAIRDLRDGLQLIPGDPRLLEMLGMIAFQQNDYALTIIALSEAEEFWLSVDGSGESLTPHAPIFLALSHFYTGNLDEASSRLLRTMETSPDALQAFLYFVVQDDDKDQVQQVADFIAPLVDDTPEHIPAIIALGFLHSFLNDSPAALETLNRAYELAADHDEAEKWLDARFFFWYAAAHERQEQFDRAEELFYRSLQLDPESAETYNYLAYMWAELDRNLETAERYVRIALEARPDSAAFIDTLGWIFYRQGRFEEAYAEIRRAAEILPDDPVITDHLGDIYLALGNTEQAIVQWRQALELDPENPDKIREKLERHAPEPLDREEADLEPASESDDIDEDVVMEEETDVPEADANDQRSASEVDAN